MASVMSLIASVMLAVPMISSSSSAPLFLTCNRCRATSRLVRAIEDDGLELLGV
jgi:hypothetical protein